MSVASTAPRMVGRSAEMDVLLSALEAGARGEPAAVVVRGEAGIGKTRLIREFLEAAAGRDGDELPVAVAAGQCVDQGPIGAPFTPLRQVLRELYRRVDDETFRAAAGSATSIGTLGLFIPELAAQDSSATGTAGAPLVAEAVERVVERLSLTTHLVLVIEDLHWADAATTSLLHTLAVTLRATHLTLVMSYRTDDVGRSHPLREVINELERSRDVTMLSLSRLDRDDVADQTAQILGRGPIPEELDVIVARSEGVPFFVEELLDIAGGRLPETLREVLLARYDRLSPSAKRAVKVASVAGGRIDHSDLEQLWPDDPQLLLEAIRDAIAASMLTADVDGYVFRHALLREAVYGELLPSERSVAHAQFAALLQSRLDAGDFECAAPAAEHWLAARDDERAFEATVAARAQAATSHAFETRASLGERLLELWPRTSDPERRLGATREQLHYEIATDYFEAGSYRMVFKSVDAALAATPPEDVVTRARLHLVASNAATSTAGCWAGVDHVAEVQSLLDGHADAATSPILARALAARAATTIDPSERRRLVERAVDLMASSDDKESLAFVLRRLSTVEQFDDNFDAAVEALERSLEADVPGSSSSLVGVTNLVDMMLIIGHYEEAVTLGLDGIAVALDSGVERSEGAFLHANVAEAYLALGSVDEASAHARRAAALLRSEGSTWINFVTRIEATGKLWNGDIEGYEALSLGYAPTGYEPGQSVEDLAAWTSCDVDALVARALRSPPAVARGLVATALMRAEFLHDDNAVAIPIFVRALLLSTARALAVASRLGMQTAPALTERVAAVIETYGHRAPDEPFRPSILAYLATSTGSDDALDLWRAAYKAVEMGHVSTRAYWDTAFRYAQAQVASGERTDGIELLRRIAERSPAQGAALVGEWARDELARVSRPDGQREGPLAPLTPREREVLGLLGEGLTNAQIASRLFMSPKTASVHVSAILAKLGAANRAEAASIFATASR